MVVALDAATGTDDVLHDALQFMHASPAPAINPYISHDLIS